MRLRKHHLKLNLNQVFHLLEVDCYILSEFKKRLLMTPKELELYELEIKRKSLEIKLEQKEFEKRRRLLDIYFDNNQKSKKKLIEQKKSLMKL